ncbi:MAG: endo-1,4-beta-xylanase, partial [Pirellulales bacterium]
MKAVHLEARRALRALGLIAIVATGARAASLNGNAFALRSTGRSSGTSWILDRNGYVGTYITLSAPGTVKVDVSADGTSSPNMNIVIDDTKAAFTVSQTKKTYSYSYSLPAGTHFVRTELSNDRSVSNRQLKINSFNVTGANISNTNTNANALAASDTYIANYRKGNARVTIPGVAPGRQVNVSLKKLNFTLGASVDWNMDPLLTENSTAAANFRSILNKNFNTVATDNEMWKATESERGEVTMDQANRLFAYAQQNGLATRMHNMIWEQVQPDWVESLKSRAGRGSASAKSELRQAISDRIDYYVGDGTAPDLATQYAELDVYNESYHAGQLGGRNTYWNIYGASGIASIFNETKQAIQAAGANTKLFVNDYDVLDDPNYMNGY